MPFKFLLLFGLFYSACVDAQTYLDTINFYDESLFVEKIIYTVDRRIDYVEYTQKNGSLRKIDFYNSKQRIEKDEVWDGKLQRSIKYSYLEKGQIVERYDLLTNKPLTSQVNVHIKYPVLAREKGIEGDVEVKTFYDENCIPSDFKVLSSPGYGIKKEVEKKMKIYVHLHQKYKIKLEDCKEKYKINTIRFALQ